jgi:hypothetical protein
MLRRLALAGIFLLCGSAAAQANDCISGNCENGQGYLLYDNGATYFGQFKQGQRSGIGAELRTNGWIYFGEWLADRKNGTGAFLFPEIPGLYRGEFKDNVIHQGIFLTDNGFYQGEFQKEAYHGKGTFFYAGAGFYAGNWAGGKKNGEGKRVAASGERKIGTWKGGEVVDAKSEDGTPDANLALAATWKYEDGNRFVGQVNAEKKRHGFGVFYGPSGEISLGSWDNDGQQGLGAQIVNGGKTVLVGQFDAGNLVDGVYMETGGRLYLGELVNYDDGTFFTGTGAMVFLSSNETYYGEFKKGHYHGQGAYYWPSGEYYNGKFEDGQRNGPGTEFHADGSTNKCVYWWGQLLSSEELDRKYPGPSKRASSSTSKRRTYVHCESCGGTGFITTRRKTARTLARSSRPASTSTAAAAAETVTGNR